MQVNNPKMFFQTNHKFRGTMSQLTTVERTFLLQKKFKEVLRLLPETFRG